VVEVWVSLPVSPVSHHQGEDVISVFLAKHSSSSSQLLSIYGQLFEIKKSFAFI
jgi:hypothetical protein